jgi:hypothetical protein
VINIHSDGIDEVFRDYVSFFKGLHYLMFDPEWWVGYISSHTGGYMAERLC